MANFPIAHIDLDAIAANLSFAKSLAPRSRALAVVKANAYGHGAVPVCQALPHADAFAVARTSEGVQLREAGISKPIHVLEGFLDEQELEISRIERLTPVLHARYQIDMLKASRHRDLPVWIKVDTGMHRLGFSVEDFRRGMTTGEALNVAGIMSHMANADDINHVENVAQIEIFSDVTRDLDVELSLANSGSIIHFSQSHFDWIRPGIMLYGGGPASVPDTRLRPAMTLTAPVIAINTIQAGETIGYGSTWIAPQTSRVALIGIGYADGYPREVPTGMPVLVHGQRRSIIGRVSMDMTFVLLEPQDQVSPGDRVTLWGAGLPVDEIASLRGTISYTLMSGLTGRVGREYSGVEALG
ncbi:MAG: alanine racemase [Pseudomonadota bacterium]